MLTKKPVRAILSDGLENFVSATFHTYTNSNLTGQMNPNLEFRIKMSIYFDFLLLLGAKLRSQPPDRAVFSAVTINSQIIRGEFD